MSHIVKRYFKIAFSIPNSLSINVVFSILNKIKRQLEINIYLIVYYKLLFV